MPAIAQTRPLKLGYVSPQTGPLAAFAEADNFIIANFKEAAKAGIKLGMGTIPVEVVVKDSQSNPNRAAQVAKDLVDRPRPVGAMAASVSSAFPSGHAIAAMVGVLALLTISAGMSSHRTRSVTIVLGVTVVLAVSFGRLAVNVHYPSDVMAGWALGYLWYLGWLLVIRPVGLARATVPDNTPEALTPG